MPNSNKRLVVPVSDLNEVSTIDSGNTVVTRFTAPDGREVALVVPKAIALKLARQLDLVSEIRPSFAKASNE